LFIHDDLAGIGLVLHLLQRRNRGQRFAGSGQVPVVYGSGAHHTVPALSRLAYFFHRPAS
jgi:hypothetical protein